MSLQQDQHLGQNKTTQELLLLFISKILTSIDNIVHFKM